ncbi:hypothetical protein [Sphingorhabdus sp.]|uniref:hypothetical protein n=1 Tax=Sphingorhabdus sp. TaxID=1902408 RepID=UPI0035AEF6FE|nr:hypothetical protein [Sphingomonadaceae bacterium]
MNWRAGVALSILAFVGGGLAISWLAPSGLSPFGSEMAGTPSTPLAEAGPSVAAPPVNPVLAAAGAPQILQPIADSARTEAMLVAMAARRSLGAGAPLGPLAPRLDAMFGASQPQALVRIRASAKEGLTPASLAAEFDAVAPRLANDNAMSWERAQREARTLFVLRRSEGAALSRDAQLQRIRDLILTGNIDSAIRLVSAMPGAANADGWLVKARRYRDAQLALDTLEQAALAMPMAAQVAPPVPAPMAPAPAPQPVDNLATD